MAAAGEQKLGEPKTKWYFWGPSWTKYDKYIDALIEESIRVGSWEVRFMDSVINLQQMTETNVDSGDVRPIKCRWCPPDCEFEVRWFFQDDDGRWIGFNDAHTTILNDLMQKDLARADITMARVEYELDVTYMKMIHKATGRSWRMKQQVSIKEELIDSLE